MHPRVQEVLSELDARRAHLHQTVANIPSSVRDARQVPSQWSVSETLEHLLLVEAPFERFISLVWIPKVKAGALGVERRVGPVTRSLNRHYADEPMSASERFAPHGDLVAAVVWERLEAVRQRLRESLLSADGLAWGDAVVTYPGLGLKMNVYHWVLWLANHEFRHTHEIEALHRVVLREHAVLDPPRPRRWEGTR